MTVSDPSPGGPGAAREGAAGPLVSRTVELEPDASAGPLVDLLPADERIHAWLHGGERGDGLVAWGVAEELTVSGPERFEIADRWWSALMRHTVIRDDVRRPGTGPIAFGSFGFDARAASAGSSTLIVPRVIVGQRGSRRWLTTIGRDTIGRSRPRLASAARRPEGLRFVRGTSGGSGAAGEAGEKWGASVAEAVRRIQAGELEKVVLARDVLARTTTPLDVRWPLARLTSAYPTCWTFHVDGLFGATPEMLVRRERGLVTSRVLAGTIGRSGDEARDAALAGALARSSKDLEEHEYAVRSVADALAPHCASMNVPESPFVLHLPNVMHLATDVTGVVPEDDATSSLAMAASLHPSAAVGGTPTAAAVELIAELEDMDRGRYAAPVGWMDAAGDGEWGIALRSAQIAPSDPEDPDGGSCIRLFAGCGIVAGSVPADELAESVAKLRPVREALT